MKTGLAIIAMTVLMMQTMMQMEITSVLMRITVLTFQIQIRQI